jgi:hypothetical protein
MEILEQVAILALGIGYFVTFFRLMRRWIEWCGLGKGLYLFPSNRKILTLFQSGQKQPPKS